MKAFLTRPFQCNHSHENAENVIVWGGTRQTLILYSIEYNIIDNITPHIVSFKALNEYYVVIATTCGIVGCGIDLKDPNDLSKGIVFNKVKEYILSMDDFKALVQFRNTGYEITK